MKILNDFFKIKSEKGNMENQQAPLTCLIRSIKNSWIGHINIKIKVDMSLLSLSIEDLISKIDIRDCASYLIMGHTYLHKHKKETEVNFIHKGEKVKLIFTKKEQKDILCCKTKRKEELNKFSFKFVRREILKIFKEEHETELENKNQEFVKKHFYNKVLQGDEQAALAFESLDLPKNSLEHLKVFPLLKQRIKDFNKHHYVEALANKYIMKKPDTVMKEDLAIQDFIEEAMSRQHKNSIVMQGVLNSLEQFICFFRI